MWLWLLLAFVGYLVGTAGLVIVLVGFIRDERKESKYLYIWVCGGSLIFSAGHLVSILGAVMYFK